MKKKPRYTEPLSRAMRRRPYGSKTELAGIIRWAALSSLFVILILTVVYLLTEFYINALVAALGILPILISILLLKRESISFPSAILAFTIILLITIQATLGQGLQDIGVMGYPVILIVAGLILRGRVIMYITFFTILCLGWLAFGDSFGWFTPTTASLGNAQDFLISAIIMLVAGNAVYRLTKNMYRNLEQADQEIETRKTAEIEREALIHQLRSKNHELDRFAIRVSHDLKTPLITVAGFLGYLEKDIKSGNHKRMEKDLTQINEAAKTMGRFVDELLDLSRVGRIINPPVDVPFEEIVQDALKAAEGLIRAKQVQVEVDAIFPFVHVDQVRVVQVMQNLIVNAVKFMGDQVHPIIRIGFEEIEGEHIFFVSDNGIGIEPEDHERIFELFSKLNPEMEGTGIGLGLVKKIVEVHGGRIWVESDGKGKGATFRFMLRSAPVIHG